VLSGTTEQTDAETRDLCAVSAKRAGLTLDEQSFAQLLEGAPYARGMVKRLRRDHGFDHAPANVFGHAHR
jgi:hypothetical protein